jgi:DNA-binding CsgD family transcriptional regulator
MRAAQALSEIRLLCSQSLAGPALVPAVVEVLRRWIPSAWSTFIFVDRHLQPTALHSDAPELAAQYQRYLDEYCNTAKEAAGGIRLRDGLTRGAPVESTARLGRRFLESEYFNEVFVPMKVYSGLAAPVRAPGGGALMLFRAPGERPFCEADEGGLEQTAGYLQHALAAPARAVDAYAGAHDEGLLVLDKRGRVQHWTARAALLVHQLMSSAGSARTRTRLMDDAPLAPLLEGMVKELMNPAAPLPVRVVVNAWGRFTLRAYWMQARDAGASGLIGASIRLQAPLMVGLIRAMRELPLSPRHKELCLCLCRGLSYADAAAAMNLGTATAVSYAKDIFLRLGVEGREGLLSYLRNAAI